MTKCDDQVKPCGHVKGVISVLTLLIALGATFISWQDRRIANLEEKNDLLVEMRTDMKYIKADMADLKVMFKAQK